MASRFVEWLASTEGSIALHESIYVWPIIESVHVLALGLFVGLAAMMDVRLLGVSMKKIPVSKVARRLLPWITAGFVVMVITGVVIFYANPAHFYHDIFFRLKIVLLILAGLNVWVFHAGIWLSVAEWDLDPVTPPRARLAGASSLLLWASIIFAGRLMAYNWFDCEHAQESIITWASGCPVAGK